MPPCLTTKSIAPRSMPMSSLVSSTTIFKSFMASDPQSENYLAEQQKCHHVAQQSLLYPPTRKAESLSSHTPLNTNRSLCYHRLVISGIKWASYRRATTCRLRLD